jgi:hypothetical protein
MRSGIFALLLGTTLLIGAAQAQETGKVPDFYPSDRWASSLDPASAAIASPTRDATIFIGCAEGDPSITLMVNLMRPLPLKDEFRTVTMVFDDGPAVSQSWFSTNDSFGVSDDELAFIATLEGLTHHRSVEFVLSENGTELARQRFLLNGAPEAINAVVRACRQNG